MQQVQRPSWLDATGPVTVEEALWLAKTRRIISTTFVAAVSNVKHWKFNFLHPSPRIASVSYYGCFEDRGVVKYFTQEIEDGACPTMGIDKFLETIVGAELGNLVGHLDVKSLLMILDRRTQNFDQAKTLLFQVLEQIVSKYRQNPLALETYFFASAQNMELDISYPDYEGGPITLMEAGIVARWQSYYHAIQQAF